MYSPPSNKRWNKLGENKNANGKSYAVTSNLKLETFGDKLEAVAKADLGGRNMNDFVVFMSLFAIVCPLALFGGILLFGSVAEGAMVFLVAFAVVLTYIDRNTSVEVT